MRSKKRKQASLPIAGVILAAGQSQRMGTPKPLLPLGSKSFIEAIYEQLRQLSLSQILIVTHQRLHFPLQQLCPQAKIIVNDQLDRGQIYSLFLGLQEVKEESSAALVCLADIPLVRPATYTALVTQHQQSPERLIIPGYRGKPGHPVIVPSAFFPVVLESSCAKGLDALIAESAASPELVETEDPMILFDINTPEQYRHATEYLRSQSPRLLRIGTRGSLLARAQTEELAGRISQLFPEWELETVLIRTTGDRFARRRPEHMGEKGIFVKELEQALLKEEIDLAVHSLKDVPTEFPQGLQLSAFTSRISPYDCLLSAGGEEFGSLPAGSRIGTCSLRRKAQVLYHRPDLNVEPLRGNVHTRVRKLREGKFDALIAAEAGLVRLGLTGEITQVLPAELMLPAAGQGTLGIETRQGELATLSFFLEDKEAAPGLSAERRFIAELGAGCHTAVGCLGSLEGETLIVEGAVFHPEGKGVVRDVIRGKRSDAEQLGKELALRLAPQAAPWLEDHASES